MSLVFELVFGISLPAEEFLEDVFATRMVICRNIVDTAIEHDPPVFLGIMLLDLGKCNSLFSGVQNFILIRLDLRPLFFCVHFRLYK